MKQTSPLPPRARDAHKGHFGHVLVIGGIEGMAGAARLCAESAARIGAGLVTVATHPAHAAFLNITRPELISYQVDTAKDLSPLLTRSSVIAIGPGLGQSDWSKTLFDAALSSHQPKVIDADALHLLAQSPQRCEDWILTPHPGEAAHLLLRSITTIQANRQQAARDLQNRYGGVIVLKGASSIVIDPSQKFWECQAGNPGMASAGMGDVLTGVIAGLLAQGLPLAESAIAGVDLHAQAGDLAAQKGGERGLLASDLMPYLRQLINRY